MRVDYLILADAAAAEQGKHYIHGGGWSQINANSFPVTHPHIAVAVRLRVDWNDTNQPHEVELDILDGDGVSILPSGPLRASINVGRPPQARPGADQVVPLALNLYGVVLPRAGDYAAVVRIDGVDEARSPFSVVDVRPSGQSGPS